jgi:hypothetical protein
MGKGANQLLMKNGGIGQGDSTNLWSRGTGLSNFLTPQLEQEALNPQGYTPQQLAYMNTASQQSNGGATGAITGQANLEAARTRNAGGFQGAIGSGSRAAMRQNSQNSVGIQARQADLQQQQRQQALAALQSLYGTDLSSSASFLNSSNQALADENQGSAIIDQNLWRNVNGIEDTIGKAATGLAMV